MNTITAPNTAIAHTRTHDPLTSHAAAQSVTGLSEKQIAVLTVFLDMGRMTDEVMIGCYAASGQPAQSESGLRTRRSELVALGKLRDSTNRERTSCGRKAIVWEIEGQP